MTPRTSCSVPIGISVATTCWPKADFSVSRVRKKSARSRSSMFTKTMRARSSSAARCHRRAVVDLDAHHGVDDEDGRLAHAQGAERVGDEAGLAGGVEEVDLAVVPLERAQRRADRHLARLLVGVAVGGRGALGDRPEPVEHAGLVEQGLVQRGLAAAAVADECHVADAIGAMHARTPLLGNARRPTLVAIGAIV